MKDLHHSLVFGHWLSPTLDYDDKLNYLWWIAALAAVQVRVAYSRMCAPVRCAGGAA